eukprot:PhM_4_TR1661/c0_g1_i1/m.56349
MRFLIVTLKNKGDAVRELLQDETHKMTTTTCVTVGDTTIDFSMHKVADLAFHVGRRSVWEMALEDDTSGLGHMRMLVGPNGEDNVAMAGTAMILQSLCECKNKDTRAVLLQLEKHMMEQPEMQQQSKTNNNNNNVVVVADVLSLG